MVNQIALLNQKPLGTDYFPAHTPRYVSWLSSTGWGWYACWSLVPMERGISIALNTAVGVLFCRGRERERERAKWRSIIKSVPLNPLSSHCSPHMESALAPCSSSAIISSLTYDHFHPQTCACLGPAPSHDCINEMDCIKQSSRNVSSVLVREWVGVGLNNKPFLKKCRSILKRNVFDYFQTW